MFKNIIQLYNVNGLAKSPLKHSLAVLLNIFKEIEFNKPLYYFTLPGIVLSSSGLYIGFYLLQTLNLGGSLAFWPAVFVVLLTLLGMSMAFTGILLHLISGLFRHLQDKTRTIL